MRFQRARSSLGCGQTPLPRPKGDKCDPRHASRSERPLPTGAQPAALALVTAFLGIAAPAAFTDQASAKSQRPPKIAEVDFFKQSGEQGPATNLEVFGRRIESIRFSARYAGDKGKATGREYKPVTSGRYGHPWYPRPRQGPPRPARRDEALDPGDGRRDAQGGREKRRGQDEDAGADRVREP